MTAQPADQPSIEPAWARVEPRSNSKLAQLHATYDQLKAQADGIGEQLDAVKAAIKLELTQRAPEGSTKIELDTAGCVPLQLTYAESWRVDARKLKAEDPEVYVRYAVKSGAWRLASARQGGGH